jgi:hypothetical protein
MAQGGFKKKSVKPKENKPKGVQKKGRFNIAPKDPSNLKTYKLHKKLTAKINQNIEKVMATKAKSTGKLTIMSKILDQEKK